MKILFIMDSLSKIHPQKDTTYLLIQEILKRDLQAYYCDRADLSFRAGRVSTSCQIISDLKADSKNSAKTEFSLLERKNLFLADFDVVLMRTDPPFDLHYLTACYLLGLAVSDTMIINRPMGLKLSNEKLYTLYFKDLCPPSLVTCDPQHIKNFVKEQGGKAVLKPIYQCGGEGVFLLQEGDPNFNVILETAMGKNREAVIVQRYIPEVQKGDKRIIVFDGEPVGAVLRVSRSGDLRSNIHVGGEVQKGEITEHDRRICEQLKPKLIQDGLFFVGLDIIGDYLTEINVTSPTGFQEINRLNGLKGSHTIEAIFWDRIFEKWESSQRAS